MESIQRITRFGVFLAGQAGGVARALVCVACLSVFAQAQTTSWNTSGSGIWYSPSTVSVGIGTSTPSGRLDVNGTVYVRDRGDGCCTDFRMVSGSGPETHLYTYGSGYGSGRFAIHKYGAGSAGGEVFTILANGRVGILTSAPQYTLAVNGTIGAKEVIVTNTGWADYVFKLDYRLKPLTEVAAFIQEHHRLPEIPSEAEVSRNGISLGEMQVKLLAKVEELTLHAIQADERNKRLEQQTRDLQEKIARLEALAATK